MLVINISVNKKRITRIAALRGAPHHKLNHHYWYSFTAKLDMDKLGATIVNGWVLHNYKKGSAVLAQRVLRAATKIQKEAKHGGGRPKQQTPER